MTNPVGPRNIRFRVEDVAAKWVTNDFTYGPKILSLVPDPVVSKKFWVTNVAYLGTNGSTFLQPDQYIVTVVQSNGTAVSGVQWNSPLTTSSSSGLTPILVNHLQTNAYSFTLNNSTLTRGTKLRISSLLLSNIACETPLNPIIIARTGVDGITAINANIAINHEGIIAFTGNDSTGNRPFAAAGAHNFKPLGLVASSRSYTGVGISSGNAPQALARELVTGPSYIVREWDINSGAGTILGSSVNSSGPADFDSASGTLDLNASGVAAVSALINGSTSTALLIGSTRPMSQAAVYSGVQPLRPQIADTGEAVIRDNIGRIVTWTASSVSYVTASSANGFGTDTGNRPGISSDGHGIAFTGNRGPGQTVFVNTRINGYPSAIVPVAGSELADGFSGFGSEQRVGVSSFQTGTTNVFTVVFPGALNGADGIYTRDLVLTNGVQQQLNPPNPVIRMGDSITGRQVTAYTLYKPINDNGQIAFSANLSDGSVVILLAAPKQ
jgi:hypothetical protein